ncbi:hypothetical protein TWF788_002907 [Orbilia oligospora]|nr:hypothetical protein TWF788_002907 [Orbilia oligospora]
MNVEVCLQVAKAKNYNYAGLEYGRECWAASLTTTPLITTTSGTGACTIKCMGNTTQSCGGRNMLNLYYSPTSTATVLRARHAPRQYGDYGVDD